MLSKKNLIIIALGLVFLLPIPLAVWRKASLPHNQTTSDNKRLLLVRNSASQPVSDYQSLLSQGEKYYQQAISLSKLTHDQKRVLVYLNKAIDYYQQAIKKDNTRAKAYYLVGQLYDSVQKYYPQASRQAEIAYKTACQKAPHNSDYLNSLAFFLLRQNRPLEAKIYLKKAMAVNPNISSILLLAKVSTQLGEVNQAIALLEKAKGRLNPEDKLYGQVVNQLRLLRKLADVDKEVVNDKKVKVTPQPTKEQTPLPKPSFNHLPTKEALANNLIIAQPKVKVQKIINEDKLNALVGQVIFPKGKRELVIKNKNVQPQTKIIIAVKEKTNQTVYVKSKGKGWFKLVASNRLDRNLTILYWLVEN